MTQPAAPDTFAPQVSIGLMDGPNDTEYMMMIIETATTQFQFFLCTVDNYVQTANTIADGIMRAGKDMRKKSGLVVVKGGLPDGIDIRKRNGRG